MQEAQELGPIHSILVENVSERVSQRDLITFFEKCGPLDYVSPIFHDKGYAFVEFSNQSSVADALSLDGSRLCHRSIKISSPYHPSTAPAPHAPTAREKRQSESPSQGRRIARRYRSPPSHRGDRSPSPDTRAGRLIRKENPVSLPYRHDSHTVVFSINGTLNATNVAKLFEGYPGTTCALDPAGEAALAQTSSAYLRDKDVLWYVTFFDQAQAERCLSLCRENKWFLSAFIFYRPRHRATYSHILSCFEELDDTIPVLTWDHTGTSDEESSGGRGSMFGGTLLHAAVLSGNTDLTTALLQKGANPNKQAEYIISRNYSPSEFRHVYPVHLAVMHSETCLEQLLNRGADPNKQAGYIKIEYDWNYTISLSDGTVLDLVVCNMARSSVDFLLERGAKPCNVFTHCHGSNGSGSVLIRGGSVLHAVAWYRREFTPSVLRGLLGAGADAALPCAEFYAEDVHSYQAPHPSQVTPLHVLATNGRDSWRSEHDDGKYQQCLALLVQHGASLTDVDGQGLTAADWAHLHENKYVALFTPIRELPKNKDEEDVS